jgi:hypothetical protein
MHTGVLWDSGKERDHLEDIGGRVILKWFSGVVCDGIIWLKIRASGGFCEYGNEPSGSIKCWEIFE